MTMSDTPSADEFDPRARLRAAQAAARDGRHDEAAATFAEVAARLPDSAPAAVGLSRARAALGEIEPARAALKALIERAPTHANVLAAAREWEALADSLSLRAALIGTGTLDSLGDHLRVAAAHAGLPLALHVGGFGQWAQELADPASPLVAHAPEVVFLAVAADALLPLHADDPFAPKEALDQERSEAVDLLSGLLDAASSRLPSTTFILHTFAVPEHAPLGVADPAAPSGHRARFAEVDAAVRALAAQRAPRVVLLDQERAEAAHGKGRVRDDRMWYMASLPYSESFLPVLAKSQVRVLRALKGRTRKCIVLDLDNTLWGGVVGEDGVDRLHVGGTAAPGNAFADLQRVLARLKERGVLLAVCSKNNLEDALPALESHPGMRLRPTDFAALRINWDDKATNLVSIARELNIGLDSLVFLDDNPAERGLVRERLPDVLVPELPRDPAGYARLVRELDVFDTLAVTAEDRDRAKQYAEQRERKAFEETAAGDLHGYLHGLGIRVRIDAGHAGNLPRIAQLINKTNQFNATTRRHTEAQVAAMASSPDWVVRAMDVADKFGESGLTAVAIARTTEPFWEIDSFLLSCRI
ncbi:MAG: HAD-IIIC family phosphatase, partial [Armatimonadota bacterium]